ncbi:MAG: sulfotransferase [Pseudomonadota bacterium]
MTTVTAADAAPKGHAARLGAHAYPDLDGARSRRHAHRPIWRLRLLAWREYLRRRNALSGVDTMVNFVGYPRSGHSLVGSILDGHPEAVLSHELDAMGLLLKGVPAAHLPALMAWQSEQFTAAGRWWNGFRYDIGTGHHGMAGRPRVVGDKKGDWAARWFAMDPSLADRLDRESPLRTAWILVTRHPLDNVATMSLRKNGAYDRLRIAHSGTGGFGAALAAAQQAGDIAREARADMVADWQAMTAAVAGMKARVPADRWFELVYEDFVADPTAECARLAAFLGLNAPADWLSAAAASVRPSSRRSRDAVAWPPDLAATIAETVARTDFLRAYADDL